MARPPALSADEVWERVRSYADAARRNGTRVHTLFEYVPNRITDVRPGSIGRWSPAGRSNSSRVTRGQVLHAW